MCAADRLIRGQVDLAQQADNCLNISHELNILRDINADAHRRLEDAYETIRELSSNNSKSVTDKRRVNLNDNGDDDNDNNKLGVSTTPRSSIESGCQVDDTSMIEHIHSLQQELIETHSRKSDLENIVRDLKQRIHVCFFLKLKKT